VKETERAEIIALLKYPRVLKLVNAVYQNIGTGCEKCDKAHNQVLMALAPFEDARDEDCSTCGGDGYTRKSFDELAGQPVSQPT